MNIMMGSLGEFFAMGGYALYVWTSFGLSFLLIGGVATYAGLEGSRTRRQTFARALARDGDKERSAAVVRGRS